MIKIFYFTDKYATFFNSLMHDAIKRTETNKGPFSYLDTNAVLNSVNSLVTQLDSNPESYFGQC